MNAIETETQLYRSEAFAEDVLDLVASAPVIEPAPAPARRSGTAAPLALTLFNAAWAKAAPPG
jgi:hypothetical protein